MIWLEWRHTHWTLVGLCLLALALGLAYMTRLFPEASLLFKGNELGLWPLSNRCDIHTGPMQHLESTCQIAVLFAGRWFDWWAALLVTLTGAYFGSRVNNGIEFLQLQPLPHWQILCTQLLTGLLALSLVVLISSYWVSTREALTLSWWSSADIMTSEFWQGTLLIWLRGVTVLLLAALLTRFLPKIVAAVLAIISSLILLGFTFDPFVRKLTFVYSEEHPQFSELSRNNSIYQSALQNFITNHQPTRIELDSALEIHWILLFLTIGFLVFFGIHRILTRQTILHL